MAITIAQRTALRKSATLATAVLAEAKLAGMSGIPTVSVRVIGVGKDAKFGASIKHEESAGVFREYTLATSKGQERIYANLSDVLDAVISITPATALAAIPTAESYSLTIVNPEALATPPSAVIATVVSLTKKLQSVREAKKNQQLATDIQALTITGNADLQTGTAEQMAKYAELVLRKTVTDHLIAVYVDQDADLVTRITAMGGTPPAP
jgi:hypothetical protein